MLDTIAAIATPLSQGAISIIRVSGDDAIEIVSKLFTKDLKSVNSHTIHYGFIRDLEGNKVDEVLVSVFKAPKTFTREDVVEVHTHGGVFITKKILSIILASGVRMALPGEFSKRAVINGRIDLAQAEAIQDLIEARSDNEAILAMQGLRGSVKKIIDPFIDDLLNMIATIEVNIDYPEYDDIEQVTLEKVEVEIKKWLKDIEIILKNARSGKIMKEGIKTAIIGKPNVGKSSILNALLEEEKAIVSNIEGTTRDVVEGFVRLEHITLQLLDTAGIRESDDVIEKIGIERSKKVLEESDFAILVIDASKELDAVDKELIALVQNKNHLIVYNKKDIAIKEYPLMIQAETRDVSNLIDAINQKFEEHQFVLKYESITNERHIGQILKAKQAMQQALFACQQKFEVDLVVMDLENAYRYMKEIFMHVESDDLLDTLFTKFCLGK